MQEQVVTIAPTDAETILFPKDSWAHNMSMTDYLESLSEEEREYSLRFIRGE
jgi:hypothetical protein